MTDHAETAILAGGCFWGVQELLRQRDGVFSTRVGYTGGRTTTRPIATTLVMPRRSRSSSTRRDHLPGHPGVLLPDPRPVDAGPPGQRRRLQLPLRDLHYKRRAGPGRSRHDRHVDAPASGRQGRHRDHRGRPFLGGRARAPGLPPADPERLHLPLPAARLEAATPQDRRLTRRIERTAIARGRRVTRRRRGTRGSALADLLAAATDEQRERRSIQLLLDGGSSIRRFVLSRPLATESDEDRQAGRRELPAAGLRVQMRSELWTGTIGARRAWTVSMISVLSMPWR